MDDIGNSSVFDTLEGALVVDLFYCTDDSQFVDISRCILEDSKFIEIYFVVVFEERNGFGGVIFIFEDLFQKIEINFCEKFACINSDLCGIKGVKEKFNYDIDFKEEVVIYRKLDEVYIYIKFMFQKVMKVVLQRGIEEFQRSKYILQKVDYRLVQLVVNVYIFFFNRGGFLEVDRGDLMDKEQFIVGRNIKVDKFYLEIFYFVVFFVFLNIFYGRSSVFIIN